MASERQKRIEAAAKKRQAGLTLVLEDVHDPHNAAAILRTADAFGVQTVHFVFGQTKPYNPRRIGKMSSSSANLWLDFRIHQSTDDCLASLKSEGYQLVATALSDNATDLYATDLTEEKLAIVVGNEHRGLSSKATSVADNIVQIPMRGFVQSLNVSVCAALVIAEITRQRSHGMERYRLSRAEQQDLAKGWLARRGGSNGNGTTGTH